MVLDELKLPIVQAPLAGGASTPRLAAAVADAGGLGFLAAGYKTPDALRGAIAELRSMSAAPFGVNIFAAPSLRSGADAGASPDTVGSYAARLHADAQRYGVDVGEPRRDDDWLQEKLDLVIEER